METKSLILIIVAAINFIMATFLLLRNRRSPINISFALAAYGAGLWAFGIGIFMSTLDMNVAVGWSRMYYFAAAIIPVAFLFFANHYLYKLYDLDVIKIFYILIPWLIVIFVIFHPTFFIESVTHYDWGNDANEKLPGHIVFALYFFTYIIWAFVILFKKLKGSEGINRKNLILIIIGTLLSFVLGITFDLILPLAGNYKLIWVGPDFTLIALIFLGYLIFYRPARNR